MYRETQNGNAERRSDPGVLPHPHHGLSRAGRGAAGRAVVGRRGNERTARGWRAGSPRARCEPVSPERWGAASCWRGDVAVLEQERGHEGWRRWLTLRTTRGVRAAREREERKRSAAAASSSCAGEKGWRSPATEPGSRRPRCASSARIPTPSFFGVERPKLLLRLGGRSRGRGEGWGSARRGGGASPPLPPRPPPARPAPPPERCGAELPAPRPHPRAEPESCAAAGRRSAALRLPSSSSSPRPVAERCERSRGRGSRCPPPLLAALPCPPPSSVPPKPWTLAAAPPWCWTSGAPGTLSPGRCWRISRCGGWAACTAACRSRTCWRCATTTTGSGTSTSSTVTRRLSASSCSTWGTGTSASCRTCASSPSTTSSSTGGWRAPTSTTAASAASTTACPRRAPITRPRSRRGIPAPVRGAKPGGRRRRRQREGSGWRGCGGLSRSPRLRWRPRCWPPSPSSSSSCPWWCCAPAPCPSGGRRRTAAWRSRAGTQQSQWGSPQGRRILYFPAVPCVPSRLSCRSSSFSVGAAAAGKAQAPEREPGAGEWALPRRPGRLRAPLPGDPPVGAQRGSAVRAACRNRRALPRRSRKAPYPRRGSHTLEIALDRTVYLGNGTLKKRSSLLFSLGENASGIHTGPSAGADPVWRIRPAKIWHVGSGLTPSPFATQHLWADRSGWARSSWNASSRTALGECSRCLHFL